MSFYLFLMLIRSVTFANLKRKVVFWEEKEIIAYSSVRFIKTLIFWDLVRNNEHEMIITKSGP